MAKVKTFEELVKAVEDAKVSLDKANAALDESVQSAEVGTTFAVDGIPFQVSVADGRNKVTCMMSKRAIAFMRGEPIPPVSRVGRPRKNKDTPETGKAAE